MPSPGAGTTGRGRSRSRLTRHIRGVVVHDGTLIVPGISDADTIRPEIVAPPSAVAENRRFDSRPITPANGIPDPNPR